MTFDNSIDPVVVSVDLDRPATGGAVGRASDGRVMFVRHALAGERVRARVSEVTAKFYRADAIEILNASPERVAAPCQYARPGGCGGCDLQHASVTAQLEWKASLLREHLRRIGGVEMDVEVERAPSPAQGSRTRLRCGVNEKGRLGLRVARSHELIEIESCWISNNALAPAFDTTWHGFLEVELRAIGDGEPFAVTQRLGDRGALSEIRSLRGALIDPSTQSRVRVRDHVYQVSPQSFWQSHRDAPSLLLDTVLHYAGVGEGDDVVDLFSGVGLFTTVLANIVGPRGRVTAVEASPHAVRDARANADGLAQVKVRQWRVTPRSINDSVRAGSVVVVDPPRQGLAKGVAQSLVRRDPKRIVYVSCDGATFARDLRVFLDAGYRVSALRALDLFPMTEHVELIALLDGPREMGDSDGEAKVVGLRRGG